MIDWLDSHLGGTEKQMLTMLEKLDRDRFDPILICMSPSPWIEQNEIPCKTTVLKYRGFLKVNFPQILKEFILILKRERIQILQAFFEDAMFFTYLASFLMGSKPLTLASRRDIGLHVYVPWYHGIFDLIRPLVYHRFDGILVNGMKVREHLIQEHAVPEDRIQVIYNGVNLSSPVRALTDLSQIKLKNKKSLFIGMTANLNPIKRIDLFLHSLAILRDSYGLNDFKAVIFGEGPERENLVNLVRTLNLNETVCFAGSVSNVYQHLSRIDIAVLCSSREGFSNAILEYMACGLPVVATAVGGNTELINPENGILVPPDNPEKLAEGLYTLIKDPHMRARLGRNSYEKIKVRYSWESTMETLEKYYQSLIL